MTRTPPPRPGRNQVYVDPKHDSLKVKPGLSSFKAAPDDAGPSLVPLLDWAREHVPGGATEHARTPVFLKASGVRDGDGGGGGEAGVSLARAAVCCGARRRRRRSRVRAVVGRGAVASR